MKPIYFVLLNLNILLLPASLALAQTTKSLRLEGRVPASVDVEIDSTNQVLRARSNFPFFMTYKNAKDEKTKYVVRMAQENLRQFESADSPDSMILEIIAP